MKTYAVNYKTSFVNRIYVIAAENETQAIAICRFENRYIEDDRSYRLPDLSDFSSQLIEGVTSRKEGIKSKLF